MHPHSRLDGSQLVSRIQAWGLELGFSQIGVAGVDLSTAEPGLLAWLSAGFHGQLAYMAAHGLKRARPAELVPGCVSVVTVRMDYLPAATSPDWQAQELGRLQRPSEAVVSLYARGRDYHKVLRQRLQKLGERIREEVGPLGFRAFTDSAPDAVRAATNSLLVAAAGVATNLSSRRDGERPLRKLVAAVMDRFAKHEAENRLAFSLDEDVGALVGRAAGLPAAAAGGLAESAPE